MTQIRRATFLLSIDTELAWGAVHNGGFSRHSAEYDRCREVIGGLLALLERYQIRATWAMVGHLFLETCQPETSIKHPEIVRPSYAWLEHDWFDHDPCSNLEAAPHWYGKDIVYQVLSCPVPQEIGCHTFSHIMVADPGCSRECFESELRACLRVAQQAGVLLQSFVFPRNGVGYLDVLARHGFATYRGPVPAWFAHLPGLLGRLGHVVDSLLPVTPPVVFPHPVGSLWNLPASYFYVPRSGWGKLVPVSLQVHKVKSGLRDAVRRSGIFHLWFHPFNLASDPHRLLAGLEAVFAEVARLRQEGCLDNSTMGELALSLGARKYEVTRA